MAVDFRHRSRKLSGGGDDEKSSDFIPAHCKEACVSNPERVHSLGCCYACLKICEIYPSDYPPPPRPPRPPPPPPPPEPSSHSSNLSAAAVFLPAFFASMFFIWVILCCLYLRKRAAATAQLQQPPQEQEQDEDHSSGNINAIAAVCKYTVMEGVEGRVECAVCLNGFQEDDTVRILPKCKHTFHVLCIDTWLKSNKNCPVCRAIIELVDIKFSGDAPGVARTVGETRRGTPTNS